MLASALMIQLCMHTNLLHSCMRVYTIRKSNMHACMHLWFFGVLSMEIRLSRYNSPFSEPSTLDIHYISLDDQRYMRLGAFDAHVGIYLSRLFDRPLSVYPRTFSAAHFFNVFDPLSGATRIHDLSDSTFLLSPRKSAPDVDLQFVAGLRKSRIKAAVPRMVLCSCGNASRPWRCQCHK